MTIHKVVSDHSQGSHTLTHTQTHLIRMHNYPWRNIGLVGLTLNSKRCPLRMRFQTPWDRLCSQVCLSGCSGHLWPHQCDSPSSPLPSLGSEVEQGPSIFLWVRGQVSGPWNVLFVPLCWMSNCRCCQKLRKGAMPVPGPTRMQGTWGFRGRWKLGALDKEETEDFLCAAPTPMMEPRVTQTAILERLMEPWAPF